MNADLRDKHVVVLETMRESAYLSADGRAALDAAIAALSVAQGQGWEAVPEHVRKLIGQIDCYRLRMSYNESYFGEPSGLLKGVFAELGHAANPIYPSGKTALYPGLHAAPAQPDGVE